jgi:citrate synthase
MAEDVKKGLLGIVVDETEVSKVMPEINSLTYRGLSRDVYLSLFLLLRCCC